MTTREISIGRMLILANRLNEIVTQLNIRARKMYPEAYKDE